MHWGPYVNVTAANEHAPNIERIIRVVKEKTRCQQHSLSFNQIPKVMTIRCVLNVCKLLNFFPSKGGISDVYSSRTILTGQHLDYDNHFCLQFVKYYQVHEEDNPPQQKSCQDTRHHLPRSMRKFTGRFLFYEPRLWQKYHLVQLGRHSHD